MMHGFSRRSRGVALAALVLSCGTVERKQDPGSAGGAPSSVDAGGQSDAAVESGSRPADANLSDAGAAADVSVDSADGIRDGQVSLDGPKEATITPRDSGRDDAADACADDDGDGICNERDRCPAIPRQDDTADFDSDGIPDACDPCGPGLLLSQHPVAYYRLDEPSTRTMAVNLVHGAGAFPDGRYGAGVIRQVQSRLLDSDPAARFSSFLDAGVADASVVTITAPAFPQTALTLALWIRVNESASSGIISYAQSDKDGNDFLLYYDQKPTALADGAVALPALQVEMRDLKAVETRVSLPVDEWHHVAVTWEAASGALNVYLDGVVASQHVYATGLRIGASDGGAGVLMLGQEQDGVPPDASVDPKQAFRGDLDEVVFYDRALSPDEVRAHVRTALCP